MKAVIQRVKKASVSVEGKSIAKIQKGMVILLGVDCSDTNARAGMLAGKIAGMRIFEDAQAKMNLSIKQVSGSILAVPQFTLSADLSRGKRPSFDTAAPPDQAREIFNEFVKSLKGLGLDVQEGKFGADMLVEIINDGPVTFIL